MIENKVKKSKYIKDIIVAVSNVDSVYIRNIRPGVTKGIKSYYNYVERVFAYEFYHQYRLIMKRKKKTYEGLYLNGEQQKSSQVWKSLKRQTPDMVLHGCINKPRYDGFQQEWLCEIKMCSNPNIIDDLKKIKEKSLKLKFKEYYFLFVGGSAKELKFKITNNSLSIDDVFEDTICICYEIKDNGYDMECKRLKEIMSDKKEWNNH